MPEGPEESPEVTFPGAKPRHEKISEQAAAYDPIAESNRMVEIANAYPALLSNIENVASPVINGFMEVAKNGDARKRFVIPGKRPGDFVVPWTDHIVLPGTSLDASRQIPASVHSSQLFFDRDPVGNPILRGYLLQFRESDYSPLTMEVDIALSGARMTKVTVRQKGGEKSIGALADRIGLSHGDKIVDASEGEYKQRPWQTRSKETLLKNFANEFLPGNWDNNEQIEINLDHQTLGIGLKWSGDDVFHFVHTNSSRFGYQKDQGKFVRKLTTKQQADDRFGASKVAEIENGDMVNVLRSTLKLLPTA